MKIFLNKLSESWIVDRLSQEWKSNNQKTTTNYISRADLVWIISPWTWKKISKNQLRKKKVVCSIYHIDETKFSSKDLEEFRLRDEFVDEYHIISPKVTPQLTNLTNKKITLIPFWINQNNWFEINTKEALKTNYNISKDDYLVGSFQRDSEGSNPKMPKLIKGPDQFLEIVEYLNSTKPNLNVILTGKRRDYLMNELSKANIKFTYFEMLTVDQINELYNILDLYIVASRVEGGPQAILECGITKTPIISTDVGIASEILAEDSIFNMQNYKKAKPRVNHAYQNALKYTIPEGFEKFNNLFSSVLKS